MDNRITIIKTYGNNSGSWDAMRYDSMVLDKMSTKFEWFIKDDTRSAFEIRRTITVVSEDDKTPILEDPDFIKTFDVLKANGYEIISQ